jgi:hypothetical protein
VELTDTQWQNVIRHTNAVNHPSPNGRNAPNVVMLTLAALVGDVGQIVASHTDCKWDAPTIWRTWAFTTSGLAHVQAEFEPEAYDALEDRERRRPGSMYRPVEPTALTAWIRSLHMVTSFAITRVNYHSWADHLGSHEDFTPLEVDVAWGSASERVGIKSVLDDEAKRERWEEFVAAARHAATTASNCARVE